MRKEKAGNHRSPNYYAVKNLFSSKPALFSLGIISLAIFTALFGYLIMPDNTPNANDGAVQIQKQPPGFEVTFIKIRKNIEMKQRSWISRALYGQESPYIIVPVDSWHIEGTQLIADIFGKQNYIQTYDLPDATLAMSMVGDHDQQSTTDPKPYRLEQDNIHYVDLAGTMQTVPLSEVENIFKKSNVEKRTFLLGTDRAGRDLLSRLIFGTRISLAIGLVSVCISLFLGLIIGSLGGFFGGKIDALVVWFMSVIWSIPGIMLVIAISIALQSRGVWVAFVAVGLSMWVDIARVVRGQIMTVKEKSYIEAARAFGYSNFRIMFRHILPNIMGPLIVTATVNFASAIMLEAGLSFLGLSVQPPTPSWGIMIFEGFNAIGTRNSMHLILFPGIAICTLVMAFNILGNSLRDAFDPNNSF
ncbi:MAG: ABC transporter permease [Cyclobacteriaceae bacterium]